MKTFITKKRPYMEGISYTTFIDTFSKEITKHMLSNEDFYGASRRLYKKYKKYIPLEDHKPPFAVFVKQCKSLILKERRPNERFYTTAQRMWKYEKENKTPLYMRIKAESKIHPRVACRYFAMKAHQNEEV